MQVFHPMYSMLYTVNVGLRDCVGFSQIWSHMKRVRPSKAWVNKCTSCEIKDGSNETTAVMLMTLHKAIIKI